MRSAFSGKIVQLVAALLVLLVNLVTSQDPDIVKSECIIILKNWIIFLMLYSLRFLQKERLGGDFRVQLLDWECSDYLQDLGQMYELCTPHNRRRTRLAQGVPARSPPGTSRRWWRDWVVLWRNTYQQPACAHRSALPLLAAVGILLITKWDQKENDFFTIE